MAQCVVINGSGLVEVTTANPCTTLVLVTPAEYAAMSSQIWNLSLEDGAVLGAGIIACWAAAYGVRAAIRALNVDDVSEDA